MYDVCRKESSLRRKHSGAEMGEKSRSTIRLPALISPDVLTEANHEEKDPQIAVEEKVRDLVRILAERIEEGYHDLGHELPACEMRSN